MQGFKTYHILMNIHNLVIVISGIYAFSQVNTLLVLSRGILTPMPAFKNAGSSNDSAAAIAPMKMKIPPAEVYFFKRFCTIVLCFIDTFSNNQAVRA